MSKVVVTGGLGFIGKATCHALGKLRHEPWVLDHQAGTDILDGFEDPYRGSDAVIHLAGILGTAELFECPEQAIDVNIKGTAKVLKMCEKYDLAYVGITMPQVWDNVYQATKLAAVKLANAWNRHRGVPVCHVRAFNVYGPGQKVGSPQKIIPTFADRAWRREPIPIWGDGRQIVDLVYVDDVANVLVDALNYGDARTIDAGTGLGLSVLSVANLVADIAGSPTPHQFLDMRDGEHGEGVVANGEGWDELGWHPEFRYEQLRATVESYRPE